MTANDKYPVRNGENFTAPIQMQLSLKPEIFSHCFVASLVSTSNFEHFEEKDDRHSYFISEITVMKDLDRPLSKKQRFGPSLDSQHVKESQTYIKSA